MKASHRLTLLPLLLLALFGCDRSDSPGTASTLQSAGMAKADTILLNGHIYTLEGVHPWAEAVAIREGKYSYVGSNQGAQAYRGDKTEVIDLQGRMAMPGINDAHSHPWQGGMKRLYECTFAFSSTPQQVNERVAECVKNNPEQTWIQGGQWTSDFFNNYPLDSPKAWLDQVSADKAVVLEDDAGHNLWVNSKALELAGITADTADPEGGVFVRDAAGEPNGLVLEAAKHLITSHIPDWSHEQYMAALAEAVAEANRFGLTGISEARTPAAASKAYQQLDREGRLSAYAITFLQTQRGQRDTPLAIDPLTEAAERYRSDHVYTQFVKIFLDGVPTASRSASMLHPYLVNEEYPESTTGMLLIKPEVLQQDLQALDRAGLTVKIHTAGDGAVRTALDAIATVREVNGDSGLRFQLAHAGYIDPTDLPRFAELNVTADLSPYIWFPSPIIDSIINAVGERAKQYWPVKDLLVSGADLLAGSDWPSAVDDMNPWPAIEALATRRDPITNGDETLWGEQAISLEQALWIFTLGGARAYRLEHLTGSVAVDKSADLIVLNQNLFEVPIARVSETQVEQTFFEGRLVYRRDAE